MLPCVLAATLLAAPPQATRLVFLERFRENLWFCGNVWALMTSSEPPAPLKNLEPVAAQPGLGSVFRPGADPAAGSVRDWERRRVGFSLR